jgi:hypothetical protein
MDVLCPSTQQMGKSLEIKFPDLIAASSVYTRLISYLLPVQMGFYTVLIVKNRLVLHSLGFQAIFLLCVFEQIL